MSPQAAAARARAVAAPAPAPLRPPIMPRRVSGPVRRRQPATRPRGAIVRVLDAPFLDRLLRGRVWIALVAFALLGIVAMQVTMLRLGASIGASVTRIQQLEQANQNAATNIARLEPGGGVASKAAKLGMVYPPPGNVVYLRNSPGLAGLAAASITRPTAPLVSSVQAAALTAPVNATASLTSSTAAPSTPQQPPVSGTQALTQTSTSATGGSGQAPATGTVSGSASVGAGGGSAAPITTTAGG